MNKNHENNSQMKGKKKRTSTCSWPWARETACRREVAPCLDIYKDTYRDTYRDTCKDTYKDTYKDIYGTRRHAYGQYIPA